jgi:hypothetical protein
VQASTDEAEKRNSLPPVPSEETKVRATLLS